MTSLAMGFGLGLQHQAWVPSSWAGVKSSYSAIGCLWGINATVTPSQRSCLRRHCCGSQALRQGRTPDDLSAVTAAALSETRPRRSASFCSSCYKAFSSSHQCMSCRFQAPKLWADVPVAVLIEVTQLPSREASAICACQGLRGSGLENQRAAENTAPTSLLSQASLSECPLPWSPLFIFNEISFSMNKSLFLQAAGYPSRSVEEPGTSFTLGFGNNIYSRKHFRLQIRMEDKVN